MDVNFNSLLLLIIAIELGMIYVRILNKNK